MKIKSDIIQNNNEIIDQIIINNEKCLIKYDEILDYISQNYLVKPENIIIK